MEKKKSLFLNNGRGLGVHRDHLGKMTSERATYMPRNLKSAHPPVPLPLASVLDRIRERTGACDYEWLFADKIFHAKGIAPDAASNSVLGMDRSEMYVDLLSHLAREQS